MYQLLLITLCYLARRDVDHVRAGPLIRTSETTP